jgi:hypothetical protein
MVRLRNLLTALTLATGMMGCSHTHDYAHWSIFHCSACDDFPMPAYGPGYSMMPGTYAGPPAQNQPSSTGTMVPPSSNAPPQNPEAITAPPEARPTAPITTPPPTTSMPTPGTAPAAGNP